VTTGSGERLDHLFKRLLGHVPTVDEQPSAGHPGQLLQLAYHDGHLVDIVVVGPVDAEVVIPQ
jgi:hypothetical protein